MHHIPLTIMATTGRIKWPSRLSQTSLSEKDWVRNREVQQAIYLNFPVLFKYQLSQCCFSGTLTFSEVRKHQNAIHYIEAVYQNVT